MSNPASQMNAPATNHVSATRAAAATAYMERLRIEFAEKWREAIAVIPHVQFPGDWKIQVVPPFSGAMARFRVQLPDGRDKSVYLDFWERIGCWDGPYWEVYPYFGDVGRCDMADVSKLLEMIAAPNEEPK